MKPKYQAQLTVVGTTLLDLLNKANTAAGQLAAGIPSEVDVDLASTRSLQQGQWTATAMITVTPIIEGESVEERVARLAKGVQL